TLYPGATYNMDSRDFFLLTGSLNEAAPPLAAVYPYNARCRMSENFPAYQSPAGDPPGVGFCGAVHAQGENPGPTTAELVGWSLPWLMMITAFFAQRHRGFGLWRKVAADNGAG